MHHHILYIHSQSALCCQKLVLCRYPYCSAPSVGRSWYSIGTLTVQRPLLPEAGTMSVPLLYSALCCQKLVLCRYHYCTAPSIARSWYYVATLTIQRPLLLPEAGTMSVHLLHSALCCQKLVLCR